MSKTNTDALAKALSGLDNKYGKGTVMDGNSKIDIARIPTGSLTLDIATGGGYGEGKFTEVYSWESGGKAQPLWCKVMTPNGWVKMGDIKVGDLVSTPDGNFTDVVGVFPQGEKGVFKITFDDGTFTYCSEEHLWQVYKRSTNDKLVLSLKDLNSKLLKKKNGTRQYYIPTTKPLNFTPSTKLPIDPYLLGLLIGDGGLTSSSVKISTTDNEILKTVSKILDDDFDMVVSNKMGGCTYHLKSKIFRKNPLKQELINLKLWGKKSDSKLIPNSYLRASVEDRISLLQGLMDSEGTVSVNKRSISYSTSSLKLSEDFEDLCRGLGFRVIKSHKLPYYTDSAGMKVQCKISYRINIIIPDDTISPFRLTRKLDRYSTDNVKDFSKRYIDSIEKVGTDKVQCIKVSHADELYITDNYIVTHNTTLAIHAMIEAQRKHPDKYVALIDAEHAFDKKYAVGLGLDEAMFKISQPDSGEQALDVAETLIATGLFSMVVIDSVAALVPESELDGEMGDSTMGKHARLMSQAMRKMTGVTNKTHTHVFWINQLRQKIGVVYGNPEVTTGGNALKFYASTRIELRRSNGDKDTAGNVKNIRVKAKTVKNKLAPPFQVAEFTIRFGEGIHKTREILDLAVELGDVKKGGSWYSYGETKLGQGAVNVCALLDDNIELRDELEQSIREHYGI